MDLDTFLKEASFEDGLALVAYYDREKHASVKEALGDLWSGVKDTAKNVWADDTSRNALLAAGGGAALGTGAGLLSASRAPKDRRNWISRALTGGALGALGGGAAYGGWHTARNFLDNTQKELPADVPKTNLGAPPYAAGPVGHAHRWLDSMGITGGDGEGIVGDAMSHLKHRGYAPAYGYLGGSGLQEGARSGMRWLTDRVPKLQEVVPGLRGRSGTALRSILDGSGKDPSGLVSNLRSLRKDVGKTLRDGGLGWSEHEIDRFVGQYGDQAPAKASQLVSKHISKARAPRIGRMADTLADKMRQAYRRLIKGETVRVPLAERAAKTDPRLKVDKIFQGNKGRKAYNAYTSDLNRRLHAAQARARPTVLGVPVPKTRGVPTPSKYTPARSSTIRANVPGRVPRGFFRRNIPGGLGGALVGTMLSGAFDPEVHKAVRYHTGL